MNIKRFVANWLSLPILAIAMTAQAQVVPFDLEIGYRWLNLKGDQGMYRTQINERSGLLIRSFTLATSDFEGHTTLADRFRIDISDLGSGPAQSLRMEASRSGAYKLRFAYRSADAFSALPAFANPLLSQGIVPGQHTEDRRRRMFDIDLDLLPDRAITPFVGFTRNDNQGPGQTTYHIGQDEFVLAQNLHERDREIRAGASFHFASVSGQITQGWRSFRGTESLTLASGAGNGNEPGTVLGQPVTATSITRTDQTHVDTPFTNAFVSAQVSKRIRLIGNYVRLSADSNGSESESAAGSFASFAIGRFYTGLTESAASNAKNKTWRGGGRAEVALAEHVDFLAGYQSEHRELDGAALINTVFLQGITFAGFDRKDIATILNARNSVDRDENVLSAGISARSIEPFAFRMEVREAKQDVNVSPDLAEIVVPGSQSGDFARRIHTLDVNGSYNHAGLMFGASLRRDSADEPVFRTDFLDRNRLRVRAGWSTPKKLFRTGVTAERTTQSNDRTGIGYDSKLRQYSGEVELSPIEALHFRGSLSQFRANSNISFRVPQNFNIGESIQQEDGNAREGGVSYLKGPFSIDASVSRFRNRGTLPFNIDRNKVRATWDFKGKTGIAAEYDRDQYEENASLGNYEASRFGLYFRWRP
ncbi:MAG: hypothetical protein QOK37_3616 [Thermoanaerobaculia bacterium]|jgi:hypothetical protein|nr:hypothetical protein [Thermoanaerobaculia bacterium]